MDEAIHLFFDNKSVNEYNDHSLSKINGKYEECAALDFGSPSILKHIPKMTVRDKNGLHDVLILKENAKYMIIANIDTKDG